MSLSHTDPCFNSWEVYPGSHHLLSREKRKYQEKYKNNCSVPGVPDNIL